VKNAGGPVFASFHPLIFSLSFLPFSHLLIPQLSGIEEPSFCWGKPPISSVTLRASRRGVIFFWSFL